MKRHLLKKYLFTIFKYVQISFVWSFIKTENCLKTFYCNRKNHSSFNDLFYKQVNGSFLVFCYIVCTNSKTFLVVLLRVWVAQALERLPTWKFDLWDLEEVKKVNLPRLAASKALGQPKIEARPPKRSRCICIQYNRRFCCIFGQRFMPSHH